MSDLDGRVVPRQTPGVDETTAGRFGLSDFGGAALGGALGSTSTAQALDSPFGTGAEAEPEVTAGTASGILGGVGASASVETDAGADSRGATDTGTSTSTVAEPIEDLRASTVVDGTQRTDAASRQTTQPATLAEPDTATDLEATGFATGLGLGGPGTPDTPRRVDGEPEQDDDEPPLFALDAVGATLDSGISSGQEELDNIGLGGFDEFRL